MNNSKTNALEIVKKDGYQLEKLSKFQKDPEIVLEAVKQVGYALQYATNDLRDNFQIVFEAVKQNGYSLEYASDNLKKNEILILEAMSQNRYLLSATRNRENLKNLEFVKEAMKYNLDTYYYLEKEMRSKKEIVLVGLKNNMCSFELVPFYLKSDKEIIWMLKKYYKQIKEISTFNLNFRFR